MNTITILEQLNAQSSPDHLQKMKRFGINTETAIGVSIPKIRIVAKALKNNNIIASDLWNTNVHEARLLASIIIDPKTFSINEAEQWVADFNSWDLCDIACDQLAKTPYCLEMIQKFIASEHEFVKRTAFVLMCKLAFIHPKNDDAFFYPFFEMIENEAYDERNFVKKAVNWALRQIGKRNEALRLQAIEVAERIKTQPSASARWIASDALRELQLLAVIARTQKSKK
jgi:3-methyladenine DNA glycosylase AlkD